MLEKSKRTQLNRALSKLGWGSRGQAESWIAQGLVTVNGCVAVSPLQWVDLGVDRINVQDRENPQGRKTPGGRDEPRDRKNPRGREISSQIETIITTGFVPAGSHGAAPWSGEVPLAARNFIYLMLHKPPGYVTTRRDELDRKTVYALLPAGLSERWLFPVGRLDRDSEGLLLMTDDGEWANHLTDPAYHVEKRYRVKLDRRPLETDLEKFRSGIAIQGSITLPAKVFTEGAWQTVTLTEGRNRQIRRMFHALGYKVKRLVREAVGILELGELASGEVRPLDPGMVEELRREFI